MTEIPDYLLARPRRFAQSEQPIKADAGAGAASEDGDFKRLRFVRATKHQRNKKKTKKKRKKLKLNEKLKQREKEVPPEVEPEICHSNISKSHISNQATVRPSSARREKIYEELRLKLFDAILNDEEEGLRKTIDDVNAKIPFSDAMMTDPENGMNALNYAIDKERIKAAHTLIEKGDETLLQHQFPIGNTKKSALLQVTEKNQVELARKILSRLKDVLSAMKKVTLISLSDQRPRELPCLHLAAFYGHTELLELYLKEGAPYGITVDFRNSKKDTALLWATKSGHEKSVAFLLENGADPNEGNDKGSTAFYWAVRYEHMGIVQQFLDNPRIKVDVHKERETGLRAPIVLAAALGNAKIVKLLLENGANKDHTIHGGQIPFHYAAMEGHVAVIRELLRHNADFRQPDAKGDTAIILAARHGHVKVFKLLLSLGDDPTRKNNLGHDAWYYAINSSDEKLLKAVLDYGKINGSQESATDGAGRPHFFTAAGMGHAKKLKFLFKAGFNPHQRDKMENTFLHHVCAMNKPEIIKEFHDYVSVDAQNENGETCLHVSVKAGFVDCTVALLHAKASTKIKNKRGETVLHTAAQSQHTTPEIAKMLIDNTIKTHDWNSLNAVDAFGNNALHIAAKFAKPDVLWEFRYLRFKVLDEDENTPLHEAVRSPDDSEGLETMLDIFEVMNRDGNINQRNKKRETVLHLAALQGYHNTIRRLLYLKADLDAQDEEGNTVLHNVVISFTRDPANRHRYLTVFETIIDECPRWWANHKKYPYLVHDTKSLQRYRRQGLVYLMTFVKNNQNLSPLALACKNGAYEILSRYLMLENVTYFKENQQVLFDITDLTPLTTEAGKKYFQIHNSTKISPDLSALEIVIKGKDKERATRVLDIPPMNIVERMYNIINAITFSILIILHIVYMSLFSYAGMELSKRFRENPITISTSDPVYILAYVVVPMEPLIFLLYLILSFVSFLKRLDFTDVIRSVLPYIFYLTFSLLTVAWLALITVQERYQDYVLAICLCAGWTYTISFTRGFKAINYFMRMILNMVVSDIRRFLIVYVCILLAFAFAFHVLFQISETIANTYPTVADTMFMVFNLMLGMAEIFDTDFETGMSTVGRTSTYAKIFYVLYLILATIVLLNMLIAMMNDSYSHTLAVQKFQWRVDSVQIGVSIETILPWIPKLITSIKYRSIPNEEKDYPVQKYFLEIPETKFREKYEKYLTGDDAIVNSNDMVHEQITKLETRLDATDKELISVNNKLDEVISLLKQRPN